MQVKKFARIVLKSLNTFGPIHGLRISLQLLFARKETQIQLPGYRSPILVRGSTSDVETFEQIFLGKEYDVNVDNLDPKLIFDLGANVGYAALFFANKYPEAKIISVEPEASNFELLIRNLADYPNIKPIQAAIWSQKAKIKIGNPKAEKWLFQLEEAKKDDGNQVNAITISELLEMNDGQQVDILKIDIESSEKELFSNNSEMWLDKINLLVIELHDCLKEGCSQTFYRALSQYNFNQFIIGENIFITMEN